MPNAIGQLTPEFHILRKRCVLRQRIGLDFVKLGDLDPKLSSGSPLVCARGLPHTCEGGLCVLLWQVLVSGPLQSMHKRGEQCNGGRCNAAGEGGVASVQGHVQSVLLDL